MGSAAKIEAIDGTELDAATLAAANIHPETRLATDYLNHFNEVVMLVEMLPLMPDVAPDVIEWQPRSYRDHFRLSNFKGRDLAIRAYERADAFRRIAFDRTIRKIDAAVGDVQKLIVNAPMDALPLDVIADQMDMRVKPLLAHAMGLINGQPVLEAVVEEAGDAQSAVDALFD